MRNLCTAFALSLLLAATASAGIFTVTNTNDSGPGSLYDAITARGERRTAPATAPAMADFPAARGCP